MQESGPFVPVRYRNEDRDWTLSEVGFRLRNAINYCDFQHSRWKYIRERWAPEKTWYSNGSRLLRDAMMGFTEPKVPQLVLPSLTPPESQDDPDNQRVEELSGRPRKWLAAQLVADSDLTDEKLLSHLPRKKLARMLVRAQDLMTGRERRRA